MLQTGFGAVVPVVVVVAAASVAAASFISFCMIVIYLIVSFFRTAGKGRQGQKQVSERENAIAFRRKSSLRFQVL